MKKAFYLILAGVAIGILIAPEKGSETWIKLKEGFEDMKDQVLDQVNDIVAQGKDLVGKGKNVASDMVDSTRKTTNEWISESAGR